MARTKQTARSVSYKPGHSPLHVAAKKGQYSVARTLLDRGANVEKRAKDGKTALHLAISSDNAQRKIIQLLLKCGANPNTKDNNGKTGLHYATQPETVQLLLQAGANPNIKDGAGCTSLHYAITQGDDSLVEILLNAGAEANTTDSKGKTPLHYTTQPETIQLLLQAGANPNIKDGAGCTSLHYAITQGDDSLMEILLNAGAEANTSDSKGKTPLHYAAFRVGADGFLTLLQHGADLAKVDIHNDTVIDLFVKAGKEAACQAVEIFFRPASWEILLRSASLEILERVLSLAAHTGHSDFLTLFFDKMQCVSMSEGDFGAALLSQAQVSMMQLVAGNNSEIDCSSAEEQKRLKSALSRGSISIPRLILLAQLNGSIKGFEDLALRQAATQNLTDMVRVLLFMGANPIGADENGKTPLILASEKENFESLLILLDKCEQDVVEEMVDSLKDSLSHLLAKALYLGYENLARTCVKHDTGPWTSLHRACEHGDVALVSQLLENGHDIDVKGVNLRTPLHQAAQFRQVGVTKLLLQRGANTRARSLRGKTPLDVARRAGNNEIVQLLSYGSGSQD